MSEQAKKTICVVDDDDGVRDSIRVLLESCGYMVNHFASADEFMRRPDAEIVDCLLLDLNMPGKSGLELLELLRSCEVATPAIILTANAEHLNSRMTKAGVLKSLAKPVSDDDLLQWIEKACARRDRP